MEEAEPSWAIISRRAGASPDRAVAITYMVIEIARASHTRSLIREADGHSLILTVVTLHFGAGAAAEPTQTPLPL